MNETKRPWSIRTVTILTEIICTETTRIKSDKSMAPKQKGFFYNLPGPMDSHALA